MILILAALAVTGAMMTVPAPERAVGAPAQELAGDPGRSEKNPAELGTVKWRRGFDAAAKAAREQGKPVFILFSEVPGCDTCKGYGERVMSHPLVVEAIETLFVPVAVYNNIEGDDRRTLESFGEPTWNNPVVRIVSADRAELAERVNGDYTTTRMVSAAMVRALGAVKKPAPTYLALLNEENEARGSRTAKAVFAVHCFWDGDQKVGGLEGVVGTKIGFLDGQEVVEVEYAPSRLSFAALRTSVASMSCATRIYARDAEQAESKPTGTHDTLSVKKSSEAIRPDAVQKYHLSNSDYRFVPMTELQACRVNAALAKREDAAKYLSARQLDVLKAVKVNPGAGWVKAVGEDVTRAWRRAEVAMAGAAGRK